MKLKALVEFVMRGDLLNLQLFHRCVVRLVDSSEDRRSAAVPGRAEAVIVSKAGVIRLVLGLQRPSILVVRGTVGWRWLMMIVELQHDQNAQQQQQRASRGVLPERAAAAAAAAIVGLALVGPSPCRSRGEGRDAAGDG